MIEAESNTVYDCVSSLTDDSFRNITSLIQTFSIATTEANDLIGKVHHRMPVILNPEVDNCFNTS